MNKKKKKKVNQLNIEECMDILNKLSNQTENKYYQEVLLQYRKLIPEHKYAKELNDVKDTTEAKMPINLI